MAHMIDETSRAQASIAFVGETPWHGLGQKLQRGADIETWRREAGLDWSVLRAGVSYEIPGEEGAESHRMRNRDVLYRSDTKEPLAVVSRTGYKIHQPAEILDFFETIAKAGGFELETAGVLSGGKRVWALAKVGEGAKVIGQDHVLPYLLLATSYDGTLATNAKFCGIRVVCHNTITMAIEEGEKANGDPNYVSSVRMGHGQDFDPAYIRNRLGIVHGAFDVFLNQARTLAEKGLSDKQAEEIIANVMVRAIPKTAQMGGIDIRKTKGFLRIATLFHGAAIGSSMTGGKSAWQLLNSVTQYVDHERGRNRDTGLNNAWFGAGDILKTETKELLLSLV